MAVLIGKEIPSNSFGPTLQDQPVLVDEFVFHAGDGVAAVAAVTEQIANEALEKIVVEYEPLPAVLDPVAAMREDTTQSARARQRTRRVSGLWSAHELAEIGQDRRVADDPEARRRSCRCASAWRPS